jgi:hypothetical protein
VCWADLHVSVSGATVKSGLTGLVECVDFGTVLQNQLHDLKRDFMCVDNFLQIFPIYGKYWRLFKAIYDIYV